MTRAMTVISWRSVARWVRVLALGMLGGCGEEQADEGPRAFEAAGAFGEVGLSPGQFSYPRCLDHDERTVWVIDKTARVQRLDPASGDCYGGWRMPEFAQGKPTGICVWVPREGAEQLVFVPDTHYHRVMVYRVARDPGAAVSLKAPEDPQVGRVIGTLVGQFGSFGEGAGQFIYPTDVAIVPTADGRSIERVFVSEYGGNDRVQIFKPAGDVLAGEAAYEFVASFGSPGSSDTAAAIQFSRPQSLAVDLTRRELLVTDACNHRVGRFTYDGQLVAWIGVVGQGMGELSYPYGLALLADGSALVAEFGNNRVQRLDLTSGVSLGRFGVVGRGAGQLATPWGVSVMGDVVYILDSGNNRVQALRLAVRHAWGGTNHTFGAGVLAPSGLADSATSPAGSGGGARSGLADSATFSAGSGGGGET